MKYSPRRSLMKEKNKTTTAPQNPGEALGECLLWLIDPRGGRNFYGRIINGCTLTPNYTIPTAGVCINTLGKYEMVWNPAWFVSITRKEQILVVVHEAAHLILRHIERMLKVTYKIHDNVVKKRVHDVLNVAADLAVNDTALRPLMADTKIDFNDIRSTIICWPEEMGFPKGQTMEFYFAELLQKLKEEGVDPYKPPTECSNGPDGATGSQGTKEGNGGDEEGAGEDEEGAGGAEEGDEESDEEAGDASAEDTSNKQKGAPQAGKGTHQKDYPEWFKQLLNNRLFGPHQMQEVLNELSEEEIERILDFAEEEARKIAKKALEEMRKTRGTLPQYLVHALEALLTPPTIPWIELFSTFLKSELSSKRDVGVVMPNIMLLDQPNLEPYPGLISDHKLNVVVGVDTSGSVSDTEFSEFLTEIYGMISAEDEEVQVKIYMYDAKLQHEMLLSSVEDVCAERHTYRYGYGGTSFEPFLKLLCGKAEDTDWVENATKLDEPLGPVDIAIMMTDGYAPVGPKENGPLPKYKPNCPLIWVLTSGGKEDDCMENRVIRITK
jgi:predicted metal-dependent peptidase